MKMIEINLLPEDLKGRLKSKKLGISADYFLYLIPLALALCLSVHIYLALFGLFKNYQLHSLNNKWRTLEPQRKMLEGFNKEYEVLSSDVAIIQQLSVSRINWAEKLNKLSLNLPAGVWFNEISVSRKDFVIRASSVSLQKEQMGLINKFINNLKNDTEFFKDFNSLELGPMQARVVAGYDIVDFVLQGVLK